MTLLTPAEVAAQLHVSRATLYRLSIPYAKIGNQRRYVPDAVIAWVLGRILDQTQELRVYRPRRSREHD
jgi:excisionase family DNA binding protein